MGNDLFVMLNNNKFAHVLEHVEEHVADLVARRHDYPIWPFHEGPLDPFEEDYHGQVRHIYYSSAILMIRTLRQLRSIS